MSLDLDTRQRAMLQEMGVRVWLPKPAPALVLAPAVPAPQANALAAPAAARPQNAHLNAIENTAGYARPSGAAALKSSKFSAPSSTPNPTAAHAHVSPALAVGIADMGWQTLSDTLRACQACALSTGRRATVFDAANARLDSAWRADWLVVGNPPDQDDEREGRPVFGHNGEALQLLDNMLKAVGVYRHGAAPSGHPALPAHTAYVTQVAKCRPQVARNPTAQELATCAHFLSRELALVQPKLILVMGPFAAQTLLSGQLPPGSKIPYGQLRGKVYAYQGIPVIVTYPPANLVRNPQDKGRAWADLCLAVHTLGSAV